MILFERNSSPNLTLDILSPSQLNIQIIASNAGINPCIIQEAKHMFKEVVTYKAIKRIKKKIIEAASIQWACNMKGVPRDSSEMAVI